MALFQQKAFGYDSKREKKKKEKWNIMKIKSFFLSEKI